MISGWVLIVAISTTGGKFIEKIEFGPFASRQQCEKIQINGLQRFKLNKICVSVDHWTGKSIDPGVSPD